MTTRTTQRTSFCTGTSWILSELVLRFHFHLMIIPSHLCTMPHLKYEWIDTMCQYLPIMIRPLKIVPFFARAFRAWKESLYLRCMKFTSPEGKFVFTTSPKFLKCLRINSVSSRTKPWNEKSQESQKHTKYCHPSYLAQIRSILVVRFNNIRHVFRRGIRSEGRKRGKVRRGSWMDGRSISSVINALRGR